MKPALLSAGFFMRCFSFEVCNMGLEWRGLCAQIGRVHWCSAGKMRKSLMVVGHEFSW